MRSDNLKRYIQKHENKPLSVDEVTEKMEYHSTLDMIALKNSIVGDINEYPRKLELGRRIKEIVQEFNAPIVGLRKEIAEALEVFENHE